MTDKVYEVKCYLTGLKHYERDMQQALEKYNEYTFTTGRLVSDYEHKPRRSGYIEKGPENQIYYKQCLFNRYNEKAEIYAAELKTRYELINKAPDSIGRALLFDRYILNKRFNVLLKDYDGLTRQRACEIIRAALESIADIN